MKRDFIAKCGLDVGEVVGVYTAFSTELLQQCLIAICIVIINVFFYPIFKALLKWFNKKLNLGVKEDEIEKASKEAEEKIKEAVQKANEKEDGKK